MLGLLLRVSFVCLAGVAALQSQGTDSSVRLHHVHYRVGDPAASMNAAAAKLSGTRVVVQGLGVGVRTEGGFVLYDRLDESDPPDLLQRHIEQAYEAAVTWLRDKGVNAVPARLADSPVSQVAPDRYHHIAFVAPNFDAVLQRLGTSMRTSSESALFDAGSGLLVEIVRESDLPDTFWCPMHPDVRSGTAGTCPVCRMELVPIPPPKLGEYRLDVTLKRTRQGMSGLRLSVRDPETNALVRRFATMHEKLLHLFIVSRDLEYFAHVHPTQLKDGSFELDHALSGGEYMLIADFLPLDATAQMVQRAIIAPGRATSQDDEVSDGGLRVWIKGDNLLPGKEGRLTFTITEPRTGAPVTDLEPYLGAPAHLLIVRRDLADALHEHPEEQRAGGPSISFHPVFPAAGEYKLWLQVQRAGRVLTFPFELRVAQ